LEYRWVTFSLLPGRFSLTLLFPLVFIEVLRWAPTLSARSVLGVSGTQKGLLLRAPSCCAPAVPFADCNLSGCSGFVFLFGFPVQSSPPQPTRFGVFFETAEISVESLLGVKNPFLIPFPSLFSRVFYRFPSARSQHYFPYCHSGYD